MSYNFKPFQFFKNREKNEDIHYRSSLQLRYRDKLTSKKKAEFEAWSIAQNISDSSSRKELHYYTF